MRASGKLSKQNLRVNQNNAATKKNYKTRNTKAQASAFCGAAKLLLRNLLRAFPSVAITVMFPQTTETSSKLNEREAATVAPQKPHADGPHDAIRQMSRLKHTHAFGTAGSKTRPRSRTLNTKKPATKRPHSCRVLVLELTSVSEMLSRKCRGTARKCASRNRSRNWRKPLQSYVQCCAHKPAVLGSDKKKKKRSRQRRREDDCCASDLAAKKREEYFTRARIKARAQLSERNRARLAMYAGCSHRRRQCETGRVRLPTARAR